MITYMTVYVRTGVIHLLIAATARQVIKRRAAPIPLTWAWSVRSSSARLIYLYLSILSWANQMMTMMVSIAK
jgi:hypothetical protein